MIIELNIVIKAYTITPFSIIVYICTYFVAIL